jgi:hypothetical protein
MNIHEMLEKLGVILNLLNEIFDKTGSDVLKYDTFPQLRIANSNIEEVYATLQQWLYESKLPQ